MGDWIYILMAVGFIVGLYFFLTWRKKKGAAEFDDKVFGFDLPEKDPPYSHRTPQGGLLRSNRSSVSPDLLIALDTGRQKYLRSTEFLGWTIRRTFADFEVWELPPTSQSVEGFPSLNMLNGQKIAGITIGVTGVILENPFIVMPEISKPEHLEYASNIVRHEEEHRGDWFNDPQGAFLRNSTASHIHPIYIDPSDSIRRLVNRPKVKFICGGCA